VAGALAGKRVILVDDSIVRGNTVRRLIRDLKTRGGALEIHLRITCPPITRPCFYGIDMSTLHELFASHFIEEPPKDVVRPDLLDDMAATMGADSLIYIPISKIPECIGFPESELCMACITGDYPTPGGKQMLDLAKENKAKGITSRTTGC
jgi:amidophosphoribosyltransferase